MYLDILLTGSVSSRRHIMVKLSQKTFTQQLSSSRPGQGFRRLLLLLAAGCGGRFSGWRDGRTGERRPRNSVAKEKKRTDLVARVREAAGVQGLGREVGKGINGEKTW